jgi:hypothetical protein
MRELGCAYYRRVAARFAEEVAAVPGVECVYLRGGILERCLPAISDLDFTIRLQVSSLGERARCLTHLREIYRAFKARYWVLGETLISDRRLESLFDREAPAIVLTLRNRQVYSDGGWLPDPRPLAREPDPRARFGLCFQLYQLGCRLVQTGSGGYRSRLAARDFSKALCLARGEPIADQSHLDLQQLREAAFQALHRLACDCRGENASVRLAAGPIPMTAAMWDLVAQGWKGWTKAEVFPPHPECWRERMLTYLGVFSGDLVHGSLGQVARNLAYFAAGAIRLAGAHAPLPAARAAQTLASGDIRSWIEATLAVRREVEEFYARDV